MMTQGIARTLKSAGFFGFPIHAWFAALLLALSAQSAVAETVKIECEDFKTVQKGEDAQSATANKYPAMGQARDGASGGKTAVFKQVMKTAQKLPFIETPVTVPQPGAWSAWVRGLCLDPMKPGTLVLMVDEKKAGDLIFPGGKEVPFGWCCVKLADFQGGQLRIRRSGGSGYLFVDQVVLTDDPAYKPADGQVMTARRETPADKPEKTRGNTRRKKSAGAKVSPKNAGGGSGKATPIEGGLQLECEDFQTVQKGEDPTDPKFDKYPTMGDRSKEGASGGKTVSFKMVKKTATRMPFIETEVAVEPAGDWMAWVCGQAAKPMKPNTLVLMADEKKAGDLAFPQDGFGWVSVKLPGFKGGKLRIQRNGGDGYLWVDRVILTQNAAYKPADGQATPASSAAPSDGGKEKGQGKKPGQGNKPGAGGASAKAAGGGSGTVTTIDDGIKIECEDFKTIQKGEEPGDPKFGKYPVMGSAVAGASGGKGVTFKMVEKAATVKPFIETPVTVPTPGDWFLWVAGQCKKPMKPGTLVVSVNGQPAGSLRFPQDALGWQRVKLAGFNGGDLRIQRDGGDGYLDLDAIILTRNPDYKPGPETPAASQPGAAAKKPGGKSSQAKGGNATQEGNPAEKTAVDGPSPITMQMTAGGKVQAFFLADSGSPIELCFSVVVGTQAAGQVAWKLKVTDWNGKVVHTDSANVVVPTDKTIKRTVKLPVLSKLGYYGVALSINDKSLIPTDQERLYNCSFGVVDPAIATKNPEPASPYGIGLRATGAPEPIGTGQMAEPLYEALQRIGIKWARNSIVTRWAEVEKPKGAFNYDAQITNDQKLLSFGISRLQRLDGVPGWAAQPGLQGKEAGRRTPQDIQDWRNYVAKTISTMGPVGVRHFEVWNEPDIKRFWYDPMSKMVIMVNEAYEAAKQADPKAVILMPGMTGAFTNTKKPEKRKWFEQIISQCKYDVINFHSYNSIEMQEERLKVLHEILEKYKVPHKPIWITECNSFIWSTRIPDENTGTEVNIYTEPQNARNYIQHLVIAKRYGADKLFTHGSFFFTADEDYSMLRKNYTPRPIILAQAAAKILGHNFSCVREFSKGEIRAFEFTSGKPVNMLWRKTDKPASITISPTGGEVQVLDLMGNPVEGVQKTGTSLQFTLTDYPVCVVGAKITVD